MFFSPIAERSFRVRVFYKAIYTLLFLGSLSMVIPLVIMLGSSFEPGVRFTDSPFFPSYLVREGPLWKRYIEARYKNESEAVRMAWASAAVELEHLPTPAIDAAANARWREFLKETKPPEFLFRAGFSGVSAAIPYYYNREFRLWLRKRYGSIGEVNQALGTTYRIFEAIQPPNLTLSGAALSHTPLLEHYLEFCRTEVPASRKIAWNAAGYYRSVFLPRTLGEEISAYNLRFGTDYTSYAEVPFPETAPEVAREPWLEFVTRFLRPDYVGLTPAGQERLRTSGVGQAEFIRLLAQPEDLRVLTLDRQFATWAQARHGEAGATIPQFSLDSEAFQNEKGFWRKTFLTQNYRYVVDEVLLHGRAMWNTLVLVFLKVGGALLVNPLAAYALSRFKLRRTYHLLLFFLVTIAFPAEVTMIPAFLQLKDFNLLNTFWALVLPGLANGFSIFLLKGFFDSLPKELYEAAEIDGASEWRMFWIITMSLSKPILAVIALNAFVSAYGAFFYALIVCPDPRMWTIMVYLYQLQASATSSIVYASLILTAIPTLLVFILCQNVILRGIAVPTEK